PAVWTAVLLCSAVNIVAPLVLPKMEAVRSCSSLLVRTTEENGKPIAVYFDSVVRTNPADPKSPLEGRGRFHLELYLLHFAGMNVATLSPNNRFASRFFFDALSPLVLLLILSPITRPPAQTRIDQFFGKMKTPVGATPELEQAAMEETQRNPHRFDHTKLFPSSTWELLKWDKVDTIGFFACCLVSCAIVALFWGLLIAAAPHI
ncbi:MAG TPA: hypothetical protein VKC60_10695, partial [Opitutaceae bacterium]|nr:hypothetical protein [Opitutaceae bacterium]